VHCGAGGLLDRHDVVDLEPGRTYLLMCNFQDSDTSAVHFHLGMARVVRVY
jgi:hypothetical protein